MDAFSNSMRLISEISYDLLAWGYETCKEWGILRTNRPIKVWTLSFLAINQNAFTKDVDYHKDEGPPRQVSNKSGFDNNHWQSLLMLHVCWHKMLKCYDETGGNCS